MNNDPKFGSDVVYDRAVADPGEENVADGDAPDVSESNSSNYGGSALSDVSIEDRVLGETESNGSR